MKSLFLDKDVLALIASFGLGVNLGFNYIQGNDINSCLHIASYAGPFCYGALTELSTNLNDIKKGDVFPKNYLGFASGMTGSAYELVMGAGMFVGAVTGLADKYNVGSLVAKLFD